MRWRLIDTGANAGKFNMDYDIDLAQNSDDDEVIFRLYQWKPYCISLGYHQPISDIDRNRAEKAGIDIVRRPTGGRAILHSEELTYSIIFPTNAGFTAKEIYARVSRALISGLEIYNPRLGLLALESIQPDFPSMLNDSSGSLCFASTAKNEVKFQHKKVIGSAQRKLQNRILQHGSIICGNYHLKLSEYISGTEEIRERLSKELADRTISLGEILNIPVDYVFLKSAIVHGIESEFNINFSGNVRTSTVLEDLSP